MPTVIQRGELPEAKLYRSTCSHCRTVFTFFAREARRCDSSDPRDSNVLVIGCPLEGCGREVYAGRASEVRPVYLSLIHI